MVDVFMVVELIWCFNVFWLCCWFGIDDVGCVYFLEGYDGLLCFVDVVISDWERFELLVFGGVLMVLLVNFVSVFDFVCGVFLVDVVFG